MTIFNLPLNNWYEQKSNQFNLKPPIVTITLLFPLNLKNVNALNWLVFVLKKLSFLNLFLLEESNKEINFETESIILKSTKNLTCFLY